MAPPLTGFFMKAVGLGEAHKQIEADERAREDRADRRDFNRGRMQELEEERHLRHLADVYDRHNRTGSPSRSVSRNQHFANGQSISSRSSRDARGAANGPPQSTHGSALDRQDLPHLPRVHRDDISQDTLAEYELPWHWDKKNKDYIIIELPLSERKLEELRCHTIRYCEQLESNKSAVSGKEEAKKIKKWRKSIEPVQAQWEPEASPQPHRSQHRARHPQAPIEQPPSRSASMARHRHETPAAGNTRQLPLRSARGPVQLGRESPLSSMRGPEPRWETEPRSASIGRGERGFPAARSARQFPSQPSRGPIPLGRERAPSSIRGSESRRGFPPMAGSLFEDGGERGRRRGDTRRFA